ncbi:transcriptional regulator [Acrocarpospora pleiomorpha]|uniref:Transcriptional regulator n=1 Tax=Acrocarpospora pleiomorpha TaxID=90975 RepID=A0A5M3Y234_9ACTN|nr:Scr1 family TA system antitoxin-like transcriptional regulator [Acrocarpospora pleiomorpha]GES27382.1 transcriptional regulator [Acrocarpospora pleiomorpha]
MHSSSSSSAQAARVRLGGQLRDLRQAAGMSGREFARAAGWASPSLVTMLEKGQRSISADHVRLWCAICAAPGHRTAELLAEQVNVAGMWLTHTQLNQAGLKARQERLRDKYWHVRLHRVYQTKVIPGLLQTPEMMTEYLTQARREQHLELDDVAEAVAARAERQRCLDRPDARWMFLLEEDVLWFWPGPLEAHRAQLQFLLESVRRPTITIGIIPRGIHRNGVNPEESFTMSDETVVSVELVSGYLSLTQPLEIRQYGEAWGRLLSLAVHGDGARNLITMAINGLDRLIARV